METELSCKSKSGSDEFVALLYPFIFVSRKSSFQLALVAWGIFLIYFGCGKSEEFHRYGVQLFQECETAEVKISNSGRNSLDSVSFTTLTSGCRATQAFSDSGAKTIIMNISLPTAMDGYELTIYSHNHTRISLDFVLQRYDNRSKQWVQIGSSKFRRTARGIRFLNGMLSVDTNETIKFDHRASWPLIFCSSCVPIVGGVCLLCMAACARAGMGLSIARFTAACLILVALVFATAALGYLQSWEAAEAFLPLSMTLLLIFVAFLMLSPGSAGYGLLVYGGVAILLRVVNECAVFDDCGYLWASFDFGAAAAAGAGAWLVYNRQRVALRAVGAIRPDAADFESRWAACASGSDARLRLAALQLLVTRLQRACPAEGARHRCGGGPHPPPQVVSNPQREGVLAAALGAVRGLCRLGRPELASRRPVRCLNQLYTQAAVVAPRLHELAEEWTSGLEGELATRAASDGPGETDEPEEADAGGTILGLESMVRSRLVKRPQRAAEKALACYGGDVSRVVDICRVRASFGSLAGLAGCLARIEDDPRVAVVRIKSSMLPPEQKQWKTAGFPVRGV